MNLELNEDQEFFRATTRKFLATEAPLTTVRALYDSRDGFDRAWWRAAAELGWTSLFVPEALGDGDRAVDQCLSFGRTAAPEVAVAEPGQDPRLHRRGRLGRDQPDCLFGRSEGGRKIEREPGVLPQPVVDQPRAKRIGHGVHQLDGRPNVRNGARGCRALDVVRCTHQQLDPVQ